MGVLVREQLSNQAPYCIQYQEWHIRLYDKRRKSKKQKIKKARGFEPCAVRTGLCRSTTAHDQTVVFFSRNKIPPTKQFPITLKFFLLFLVQEQPIIPPSKGKSFLHTWNKILEKNLIRTFSELFLGSPWSPKLNPVMPSFVATST